MQATGFPGRLQAPRRLPSAADSRTPTIPCSPVARTSRTGAGGRDATASSSALNSARFDLPCIPVMVSSFPVQGMVDGETKGLAMIGLH